MGKGWFKSRFIKNRLKLEAVDMTNGIYTLHVQLVDKQGTPVKGEHLLKITQYTNVTINAENHDGKSFAFAGFFDEQPEEGNIGVSFMTMIVRTDENGYATTSINAEDGNVGVVVEGLDGAIVGDSLVIISGDPQ